jgi:hypothetical protein
VQTKTLFSQHHLHNRLPDHPEWAEDPRPAPGEPRALWAGAAEHGETWNEAQTEAELVRPVLEVPGRSYIVQARSRRAGQVTRPDYALFADLSARDAAYPSQGDGTFYGPALAASEAKHWGRRRSHKDGSGRPAREAFPGVKAPDPSMGSGHFPVNAVDYLTDRAIRRAQTCHGAQPEIPWDRIMETSRETRLARSGGRQ